MLPAPRTLEPVLERWLHAGNLEALRLVARSCPDGTRSSREDSGTILHPVERTDASTSYMLVREELRPTYAIA